MSIKFYHRGKPYYEFTNFDADHPFNVNLICDNGEVIGGPWPTSEHLFQAAKFVGRPDLVKKIRDCGGPGEVYRLANGGNGTIKNDGLVDHLWRKRSLDVMRWVIYWKFKSHTSLTKQLLDSGYEELIEDTESDTKNRDGSPKNPRFKDQYWGNATKYDKSTRNCLNVPGDNYLGKILMETREILRQESRGITPSVPQQPFSPSPNLPTPPSSPRPTPIDTSHPEYYGNDTKELYVDTVRRTLNKDSISENQLSSEFHGWESKIRNFTKKSEAEAYWKKLAADIERLKKPQPKPQPVPQPKADISYRNRWIEELEKKFQELEFGNQSEAIRKELSIIKDKIKGNEFDSEKKIDILGREFLDILKTLGKKKSAPNLPDNPPSPAPIPNVQNPTENPPVPENQKTPDELTPEEKEQFLNKLKNLSKKSPEEYEKESNKPVEINLDHIKAYFKNNGIDSMTLGVDGELTIEFQNKTTKKTLANDEWLQQIKDYLQQKAEKSVNRAELNISENTNQLPTKPNYLPRLLWGAGSAILVIFFALIVLRQKRINSRKPKKTSKLVVK